MPQLGRSCRCFSVTCLPHRVLRKRQHPLYSCMTHACVGIRRCRCHARKAVPERRRRGKVCVSCFAVAAVTAMWRRIKKRSARVEHVVMMMRTRTRSTLIAASRLVARRFDELVLRARAQFPYCSRQCDFREQRANAVSKIWQCRRHFSVPLDAAVALTPVLCY